jgi:hypothetical protein
MFQATLEREEITIAFTAAPDRADPDYVKYPEVEEVWILGVKVDFKSLPKELQQELEELAYEVDEWNET